jgi:hypothetical protein
MGIAPDSPLLPLSALYRGRIIAWDLIESSTIRGSEPMKHWAKDTATGFFQQAADAFPKNDIAKMYLGTPIPWGHAYEPAPGEIVLWWIEKRQDKSGQYGGGRGDDCEMWRWWAPLLLGFDEPKIRAAQLKMSKNTLRSADLQKFGYNDVVADVEHSAEDTADSLIPLLLLEPHEPKWTEGARQLARLMRDVWTGRNERGQLQFKSFYFSATEVAPQPYRALDVLANVGAINPALVVWQRTGDPEIGAIIAPWLETWVDATARAENGKPAGILPASIRWPDGAVAGSLEHWWEPVKPGGYMYTYYLWPSISTELTNALALAAAMTGDQKFLNPLRSMAALRLAAIRQRITVAPPGSAEWCAQLLAPRPNSNSSGTGLVKSLARARALTGTREFDELIAAESGEFAIRDDATARRDLEAALRASLETLRVNFAGFTSEVRATDRVLRFVQFLARDYDFDGYQGVTLPKHELLYRMITGDQDAPRTPNPAVHWRTPAQDFAVLVTKNLPRQLDAELYHFGNAPRRMSAEFLALPAGDYTVQLTAGGEAIGESTKMTVEKGKAGVIDFELQPRKLCVLRIAP